MITRERLRCRPIFAGQAPYRYAGSVSLAPRRVFLSHTSELREIPTPKSYVAAVETGVHRAGDAVVDMEYFGAAASPPAALCREIILSSEVYVLVAGFRYGSLVHDRQDASYCELEFDIATRAGLPRLIFMLDERKTEGPKELFTDERFGVRQAEFRQRLLDENLAVQLVSSPQELEIAVFQSLANTRNSAASARKPARQILPDGVILRQLRASTERLHARDLGVRLFAIEEIGEILAQDPSNVTVLDLRVTYRNLCRFILQRTSDRQTYIAGEPMSAYLPDVAAALAIVVGELGPRIEIAADLSHSHLRGADLIGAWLVRADLRYGRLDQALLAGAQLPDSDLSHASLKEAQLRHADLKGSNLRSASLEGADLTEANLTYVCLDSTDFTRTILDGVKLSGSFGKNTLWPDGFEYTEPTAGREFKPPPVDPTNWDQERDQFDIESFRSGDILRLAVTGEVDSLTAPILSNALMSAVAEERATLQLDLTKCSFFGMSPGASVLINIREILNSRGSNPLQILAGGNRRRITRGFHICGIYDLFEWPDS